jgi:preprotein translocase subunit SecG
VVVTVKHVGDDNVITWTVPGNLPGVPAGVQIWRSLSPFVLAKTLTATDTAFLTHSYTDVGQPETAKYLVTYFYSVNAAGGFSTGDPSEIPGFAALGSGTSAVSPAATSDNGLSTTAWILIVLGILVVLALIVVVILLVNRKKKGDQEEATAANEGWATEEPAAEAAPEAAPVDVGPEVHTLRCPACSTEFQATGAKPITTSCPSCGRRGVLR